MIKNGKNMILSVLLLASILFTTLVYSAFSSQLQISGEAVVKSPIEIKASGLKVIEQTNGAYETYNNKRDKDTLFMYATLPSDSSITYEFSITNNNTESYILSTLEEQSHTNTNVEYIMSAKLNDVIDQNTTRSFTVKMTNNTDEEQIETLVYKIGFKENKFTVTFNPGLGSVTTSTKEVKCGSKYDTLPTPIRGDYQFLGWYLDTEFTKSVNENTIVTTGENHTLYAKWETREYTLTNLITNGSFEEGVSEWGNIPENVTVSQNSSAVKYGTYSLEQSINSSQSFLRASFFEKGNKLENHIVYVKVSTYRENTTLEPGIYVSSSAEENIWPAAENVEQVIDWYSVSWNGIVNEWKYMSTYSKFKYNYLIIMLAQAQANGNGSIYFDGLLAIDLTAAFGEGNEPSKEWCDKNINYFDDTTTITY